jgi:hypothetical protein
MCVDVPKSPSELCSGIETLYCVFVSMISTTQVELNETGAEQLLGGFEYLHLLPIELTIAVHSQSDEADSARLRNAGFDDLF